MERRTNSRNWAFWRSSWRASSISPEAKTFIARSRLLTMRAWKACSSVMPRSEEHTSELQSLMRISYAVFSLIKKTNTPQDHKYTINTHLPNGSHQHVRHAYLSTFNSIMFILNY